MTDLKCPRCGRDGHIPADCDVPVLPDDRVLAVQPEALRLADELLEPMEGFPEPTTLEKNAASLLRTQHAAIERKDALLLDALSALKHLGGWSTTTQRVSDAIIKELQ